MQCVADQLWRMDQDNIAEEDIHAGVQPWRHLALTRTAWAPNIALWHH